jgi:hypothetical protein
MKELEKRVERLEAELQSMKDGNTAQAAARDGETSLQRHSRESYPAWKEAWDEMFAELGIEGEPIEAEKLQEMIGETLRKQGINPEDNIFSREIIAMREE